MLHFSFFRKSGFIATKCLASADKLLWSTCKRKTRL